MKINNTSVRGIYLYNPEVEFEYGDFVISGDSIYIAKPINGDSIFGVDPTTDTENYELYLNEKTASLDYSLGYLNGEAGSNSDMFVSSYYLQGILNNFLQGFDEKGVITDYIDLRDGVITTTERYFELVDGLQDLSSIFDKIVTSPNLNNAYLKVSRTLVASDNNLGLLAQVIGEGEGYYVILRQYTYTESEKTTRVQELVDPSQAYVMYRRVVLRPDYSIQESSPFTNSFYTQQNVGVVVQKCINYLENINSEYRSKYDALAGSFRFREIEFEGDGKSVMINPADVGREDWSKSCIVTINTSELNGDSRLNNSITFDLTEEDEEAINYYITDNTFLTVTRAEDVIVILANGPRNSNFKIINIYYREVYNNEN